MNEEEVSAAIAAGGKMSSLEAAALIVSGGKTKDLDKAVILQNEGNEFNMDGMQRAHLRRLMGFDFKVRVTKHKIYVTSKEGPEVRTRAALEEGELDDYGNIIKESAIDKLVDACARLKEKWDEEVAKRDRANVQSEDE
jgi:hypothetical protein